MIWLAVVLAFLLGIYVGFRLCAWAMAGYVDIDRIERESR